MGVQERRARQKQWLRREILDAARDLFVKEGYENVSMRRIAEKIEYSPTTIYLYFEDKADLLFDICEETFERLSKKLDRILKEPGDPVERLKKGLRAYVEFGLENPQHYKVTFILPHPQDEDPTKYLCNESAGMKAFSYLRSSVAECVQARKLGNVDVDAASQVLWASAHGVTSLLIIHQHFPWVERKKLIDLAIDAALAGLAA